MSNGIRVRRDVQSLLTDGDDGEQVLRDYAEAITKMRQLDPGPDDPADPLSWRFQAAIHGLPGLQPSPSHPKLWSSCRHNSWFFLAWHRVYLLAFEKVIQFHLDDDTWALPYWDYTKTDDDTSRVLPAPFRSPRTNNPLFTSRREPSINAETNPQSLPAEFTDAIDALKRLDYALEAADSTTSFGGGIIVDAIPGVRARGTLELTPHGLVHGGVGGENPPGLMSRFETAGLDPIFWLHHCNLDRLWDVWIVRHGADALPDDQVWLDTEFEYFDTDKQKKSKPIADILVSADLGYSYESIEPPAGTPAPRPRRFVRTLMAEPEGPEVAKPDIIGATTRVDFSRRSAVPIGIARRPEARGLVAPGGDGGTERWYLRVEDIEGKAPAVPAYGVYLNLPDDASPAEHADRRVGTIASFGITEASEPAEGGIGVTDVFEITDAVEALREAGSWDEESVWVTIVPMHVTGEAEDGGDVRAGRISIYAG